MKDIFDYLKNHHYKKVKFKVSKTNHLTIKATLNGVKGDFILDTGASNSCIALTDIELFNLNTENSEAKASGAGSRNIETQSAKNNLLKLGKWKTKGLELIVIDLSHINEALKEYKAQPTHGIIGADILLKGKAIIDYSNKYLYLK